MTARPDNETDTGRCTVSLTGTVKFSQSGVLSTSALNRSGALFFTSVNVTLPGLIDGLSVLLPQPVKKITDMTTANPPMICLVIFIRKNMCGVSLFVSEVHCPVPAQEPFSKTPTP